MRYELTDLEWAAIKPFSRFCWLIIVMVVGVVFLRDSMYQARDRLTLLVTKRIVKI